MNSSSIAVSHLAFRIFSYFLVPPLVLHLFVLVLVLPPRLLKSPKVVVFTYIARPGESHDSPIRNHPNESSL